MPSGIYSREGKTRAPRRDKGARHKSIKDGRKVRWDRHLLIKVPIEERFWSKVDKSECCWLWTAGRTFSYVDAEGEQKTVHPKKFAYELEYGPIEPPLLVLYRCDNVACIRPTHLYTGTRKKDFVDRLRRDLVVRGEENGKAKLTEMQVKEILVKYALGEIAGRRHGRVRQPYSMHTLAAEYNVCFSTIGMVVRRQNWKHVEEYSEPEILQIKALEGDVESIFALLNEINSTEVLRDYCP